MREPFKVSTFGPFETLEKWLERNLVEYTEWANQPAHLTATPQVEQPSVRQRFKCCEGCSSAWCAVHKECVNKAPEQPAAGDDAVRELLAKAYETAGSPQFADDMRSDGHTALIEALRQGISAHIAKQVVPEGEVQFCWGSGGGALSGQLRQQGFAIIRLPDHT